MKNGDGIGIFVSIILLLAFGIFFFIKYAIIGLIMIIASICIWIANKSNKNEKANRQEKEQEKKNNLDFSWMVKDTMASGEKRKKFKTKDGIDVEIIIDNDKEDEDDELIDDEE